MGEVLYDGEEYWSESKQVLKNVVLDEEHGAAERYGAEKEEAWT